MSQNSNIEWTEATWNCLAGCSEVSPGCARCYAAVMAHRLAAMGQAKYQGTTKKLPNGKVAWTGKMNLDEEALLIPLKRKKPTTWFVNSMSDLFHEDVPDEFIDKVFAVMGQAGNHTFQVLTKRAERMASYVNRLAKSITPLENAARSIGRTFKFTHEGRDFPLLPWPIRNVWLGVSVENRQHGLPRIEHLLKTPAAVRFLSVEPLLEDVGVLPLSRRSEMSKPGTVYFDDIHWVIVGGESGHGARPMHPDWVRPIRDQCIAACVPFFFKQWGAFAPMDRNSEVEGVQVDLDGKWRRGRDGLPSPGHAYMERVGKKAAGRLLDGRTWDEYPATR